MYTLEEAIQFIEDTVSGCYREKFPDSKLRKNTREQIEFLKFNFETLSKTKDKNVKLNAIENIFNIVFDNTLIPESWRKEGINTFYEYNKNKGFDHRLLDRKHDNYKCIECCDIIINRLNEEISEKDDLSIAELNNRYVGKWLYFNGDESGSEWLYVKNIHRDIKIPVICVDGILIRYNGQSFRISVDAVENVNFGNFYYFGCEGKDDENYGGYTKCTTLNKAIMSTPLDTNLNSHIVSSKDVVIDILNIFAWMFKNEYDTRIPEIGKIFDEIIQYESNR